MGGSGVARPHRSKSPRRRRRRCRCRCRRRKRHRRDHRPRIRINLQRQTERTSTRRSRTAGGPGGTSRGRLGRSIDGASRHRPPAPRTCAAQHTCAAASASVHPVPSGGLTVPPERASATWTVPSNTRIGDERERNRRRARITSPAPTRPRPSDKSHCRGQIRGSEGPRFCGTMSPARSEAGLLACVSHNDEGAIRPCSRFRQDVEKAPHTHRSPSRLGILVSHGGYCTTQVKVKENLPQPNAHAQ
jgi:hypothetical protein